MKKTAICSALFVLFASGLQAGPFDQDARDFAFSFSVNGYEPDGWFAGPSSLVLNERSSIMYIADTKAGYVDVFSLQGSPKSQLSDAKAPFGLAVDKDGNLYISENEAAPIKVINPKGEVSTFEIPTVEGEKPPQPGCMTTDRDGNLYVVDRANSCIHIFDKEKKEKFKIGKPGDKRGEFKTLQDVAVDRQGRIYALDSAGTPVQVFDKKGKYIYRFGFIGDGYEDLALPTSLFVDRNDQIWIVDQGQHCLKVFDRSGSFLRKFGIYGLGQGTLFQPVDAKMDNFGRIYVLEAGGRRLQVFTLRRPSEPFNPPGL